MVIVSGNSFLIYKQRQWGDFINWERVYFCSVWSKIMNSSVDPSSRSSSGHSLLSRIWWLMVAAAAQQRIHFTFSLHQPGSEDNSWTTWSISVLVTRVSQGRGERGDCECQAMIASLVIFRFSSVSVSWPDLCHHVQLLTWAVSVRITGLWYWTLTGGK